VLNVINVAPTLTISGPPKAITGEEYTLSLSSSDPGVDAITGWEIYWNDGNVQTVPGNPGSVAHTYAQALPLRGDFDADGDVDGTDAVRFMIRFGQTGDGLTGDFDQDRDVDNDDLQVFASTFGRIGWGTYLISATASDEDGTYQSNVLAVLDPPAPTTEAVAAHKTVDAEGDEEPYVPPEDTWSSWTASQADEDSLPGITPLASGFMYWGARSLGWSFQPEFGNWHSTSFLFGDQNLTPFPDIFSFDPDGEDGEAGKTAFFARKMTRAGGPYRMMARYC
jgi:hypothetical protein